MVKSMTAFSRCEDQYEWGTVEFELRSVNHRFLDLNVKMIDEYRPLEIPLREAIKQALKRGKVDVIVRIYPKVTQDSVIEFDEVLAQQLSTSLHKIDKMLYNAAPVSAVEILNWPGVMKRETLDLDAIQAELLTTLNRALEQLIEGKQREGLALKAILSERIIQMREIVEQVGQALPEILQLQKQRLTDRLAELKSELDQDRLEQEMVYLAQKADVDEELDRIVTHLDEIQRVLNSSDVMGRRLDFLMQELNREANTLGSKSISKTTTQASVDMKVLIEQMREQIQNIE